MTTWEYTYATPCGGLMTGLLRWQDDGFVMIRPGASVLAPDPIGEGAWAPYRWAPPGRDDLVRHVHHPTPDETAEWLESLGGWTLREVEVAT